ncbi:MAG TPA: helicase-related protein, partial [Burkholderiaceae bacterium]|nr:helicase-related protein [Burkholderiaceae bacterium]
ELAFRGYPDSFGLARRLKREVTLYVGPPNSGKTHAAFERLAKADSGVYLAPLRLLALEGRDRLQARDIACTLLTGEEHVPVPGARVVSSTVEMVNTREPVHMAVIDEAQMLFDADRGWAWTQAILGVPAQELILICSAYAVEAIQRLLEVCGERCDVRHFERKQHVMLLKAPVSLASLRKGDAVVAFSRREVLSLRDRITEKGHKVSVVYGALPPEVRRREAERFSGGDSHVLVATDAIGMGLNLPIRRVLFSTMTKFDGEAERDLSVSELHQIAGRAGRFGIHEEGFVGMLREGDLDGLRVMRALLARQPKAPADFKARVAPNWWHVETIAAQLGQTDLANTLGVFMKQLELDNEHFEVAALDPILQIAGHLDHRASALDLRDRFIYAQAPVNADAIGQLEHFLSWAEQHARTGQAGPPSFVQDVDEHSRLDRMEQGLRLCSLWLWLDLRFPCSYGHLDEVLALRDTLNNGIERQLKSRKPLWETRRRRRVRGA